MTRTRWAAAALPLALVCSVTGCARPASTDRAVPDSPTTAAPVGSAGGAALECAPVDGLRQRLPRAATVTAGLLCDDGLRVLEGRGEWSVRLETRLTGAQLGRLVVALRLPDDRPPGGNGSCTAEGHVPPDLRLRLADGGLLRPELPHTARGAPLPQVVQAFAALPDPLVVPLEQLRSATAVEAGCQGAWKDVLTGELSRAGPVRPPELPPGPYGVCRYTSVDGELHLVASGTTVGPLDLSTRPRTGPCPTAVSGAVLVRPTGDSQRGLWVETGGCGRLVDALDFTPPGAVDAARVDALAALASTPEPG